MRKISRREWLACATPLMSSALLPGPPGSTAAAGPQAVGLPPSRAITKGPKHHWFGYYDKLQVDTTGRRVLGMEVDFEHRSPRIDDEIGIGYIDLTDTDAAGMPRWVEVGRSRAWGWQQGCMLQWRPGSTDEILWNDRDGDRFVCHVLNLTTGAKRTLPMPVYTVAPDGRTAFTIDFGRLQRMRPGYGYAAAPPAGGHLPRPDDIGIWRMDLDTGAHNLVVSIAEIAAFEPDETGVGKNHWFNHLLVSPDSTRLEFLHRWNHRGFTTRMLTMNADGTDRYVLDQGGLTSHFIWRDPEHILAWAKPVGRKHGFWVFRDKTHDVEQVGEGVMTENGHCTYLSDRDGRPGTRWILNDTYPDSRRLQHPYLFDIAAGRKVPLGSFETPAAYSGEWRCDTHPRSSRDGMMVCIDSPVGDSAQGGDGRQMHLIDISAVV